MPVPTTEWREAVAPDEASRFAGCAGRIVEMQKRKSAKYGNGRELHRKQLLALRATLDALAEHRPPGEVMRARRVVYFASEKTRGAL